MTQPILCGVMVRTGVMVESRPCYKPRGHVAPHAPDLVGMKFGAWTVTRLAPPHPKNNRTCWYVAVNGIERTALSTKLTNGERGTIIHQRNPDFKTHIKGHPIPEYSTVHQHWQFIFAPQNPHRYRHYVGMPFFDEWNPNTGGAWWKGAKWIRERLGPKPGAEWSMDIIDHDRGFVPGNLRWARYNQQVRNQRHRGPGKMSIEELEVEARRHGFRLVPLERIAA